MGSIFRKIQRCSFKSLAKFISRVLLENIAKTRAKIDRASSEMLVSKCDTRTEQIFHPRQFFVSRELARIPRGLVTSRSFARLIASLEILASSPFLFSLFRFFLETQIRVANFPPLCSVTAIKFGIQKCTIIFLTCEITYRRMDLTIARRTMRSESKTALSFLIAQFHRMSQLRIYLEVKESSPKFTRHFASISVSVDANFRFLYSKTFTNFNAAF